MNGEFDLYGVFLPRLLVCGIAALFLMRFITRLMARWRLYRLLWHPPLVDAAVFILCVSLLNVLISRV
ncbi:DUF1656 domain-containing protein [Pseudoxanthobacter sp.]|uniref:DUF1656 domain-containing protein n=1 Tax=Pseudoxanthobacter sp. TaxID=1925742 RepID=UPI002FE3CACE